MAQRRFGGSPGSAIAELTSCTMQQAIVCRRKRLRIRQSHPLRGPKPVRALREIGLAADVPAPAGDHEGSAMKFAVNLPIDLH